MNIYSGLLFLHGHIADAELARQLAGTRQTPHEADPRLHGEAAKKADQGAAPVCHAGRGTTLRVGR